jgi:hypothetical protein
MQLTFLYEIHLLSKDGNYDQARQWWFTEGVACPFNTLCSIKHRDNAIVHATPTMPHSIWTDCKDWTSLMYLGNPVSLDDNTTTTVMEGPLKHPNGNLGSVLLVFPLMG